LLSNDDLTLAVEVINFADFPKLKPRLARILVWGGFG